MPEGCWKDNLTTVDCMGLVCPMPIVKVRLALNSLKAGDLLTIHADDPHFSQEFLRFCYLADIELISRENHTKFPNSETFLVKVLK